MAIETLWTGLWGSFEAGVLPAVGAAVFRNVIGWLQNSMKDGEIQKYEWNRLGKTLIGYVGGIIILSQGLPLDTSIAAIFGIDLLKTVVKK